MVYHQRTLNNYFIPYHRKFSGLDNEYNMHSHEWKVECENVEYTMALLYFDGLCFLWHGTNGHIKDQTIWNHCNGIMSIKLCVTS